MPLSKEDTVDLFFPSPEEVTQTAGLPAIAAVTGFYKDSPGALTARLTTLEYQFDILHMLSTRVTQVESRLESLEVLSSLILDVKLRLDALDVSPTPRNFARRADGARTIKGLTSSNRQWGRVLSYFRLKSSTKAVPPSLVLDETLSSYCWEFVGN
ncbi:hypothetical protein P691DRAFT_788891 [Macrolepiota fuliginosa MF-IS2]|uniref:Uncharacterized protein n=1 Tax=Macrolepiota fuliginosa MF-IS2 TaxID=1400762 RepID=A0A9P6BYW3_9AGAR|nr:hypothetical protein P691DRAFT_788891 [Macrolepiota fuliginosa MF-IS2]